MRQALPITASQLAERSNGRVLLTYLGQRDASAAVCDLNARGPHLAAIDATVGGELMEGLREGRLAPALWSQCVGQLVRSADPIGAASLLDAVAYSYGQVVIDTRVENDAALHEQLAALQALLIDDSNDAWRRSDSAHKLLTGLNDVGARHRLGPLAQRSAAAVIADLELTNGVRNGARVDIAILDELFRTRDDSTLQQYALRLPDSSLRTEARRRVIRLRVEQSPLAAVRDNAAAVEDTLMRYGVNPVSVTMHPVRDGAVDTSLSTRRVVVRQDLAHQTTTLVGTVDDQPDLSVLPQLSLRGALRIELEGIDGLVTLCDPPEALNPLPCVSESAVSLDSKIAYLERDGTIRFVDHLSTRDALALARGDGVVVPIAVGGKQLATLDLGLRFETPKDLVLTGGGLAANGPDLRVRVEPLAAGRLSYTVARGKREYVAVVEGDHATDFHVITQGTDGTRGRDGAAGQAGMTGTAGMGAICPSSPAGSGGRGGDGGPGEDGGAGGDGGSGGNVTVAVVTLGTPTNDMQSLLRKTVLSQGGAGGSGGTGGSGGRGGDGGPGGAGTTCVDTNGNTTFLSAGSAGFSGSDGRSGFNGIPGSSGRAGRVTIEIVAPR